MAARKIIPCVMHRARGLTLIELLIVLAVMSLLAAIAFGSYRNAKSKAYMATMEADLNRLRTAEESWFIENHAYSMSTTALGFTPSAGISIVLASSNPAMGYAAIATVTAFGGGQCGLFVGEEAVTSTSGTTVCTQENTGSQAAGASGTKK